MKKIFIAGLSLSLIMSLFGCATSRYQTIEVTSDPNGATVETSPGDSIVTPGSFNLLRNQNHILTANSPGYEPMEKEIKSKSKGLLWQELEPEKVHFHFMWLEPDTIMDPNQEDPNAPGKIIVGYRVRQESPGKFVKIPVYEDEPNEPPAISKSEPKKETSSDFELGLQRHSIEIGPEAYFYRYREPTLMKDEGAFYGGVLNYQYRGWVPASPNEPLLKERSTFRAGFRFASGEADYDGALLSGIPYTIDDIEYNTYETQLLLGLEELDKDWLASLYGGIGYRYSNDDSSFDPNGYERESNYLYIPIVYQLDGKFENDWAWGCKIEADIFAWGKQKTHLSDVGSIDLENKQEKGYGLRGSIMLQNKTKNGILTIEPFIRYWNIEDSEVEYIGPIGFIEPENNTTEAGIQILWRF